MDWFLIWPDLVQLIQKVAGNRLDSFGRTRRHACFGLVSGRI